MQASPGPPPALNSDRAFVTCLERQAAEQGLVLDASQQAAGFRLQALYAGLLQPHPFRRIAILRQWIRPPSGRGIYLWGGLGRGKSFIMDAFFSCIPLQHKKRIHFHRFMQEIHARLSAVKGQADPLARVAREISRHVRLLCLDEFHITDITDAMLMRGLLQGLLDRGVVLVITSNAPPEHLYRNGLQRAQFLPAIELIRERLDVVHLDGGEDYRLRTLEQAGLYHAPLDAAAEAALTGLFEGLAGRQGELGSTLRVEGRDIPSRRLGPGVGWFDFAELCAGPRGQADYIELARRFHSILLSGVPQFDAQLSAEARRFLWLVDEFYDCRVKLVLSAAVPLAELVRGRLFDGEFERTLSRLAEMQSHAYLAQPHQPR